MKIKLIIIMRLVWNWNSKSKLNSNLNLNYENDDTFLKYEMLIIDDVIFSLSYSSL